MMQDLSMSDGWVLFHGLLLIGSWAAFFFIGYLLGVLDEKRRKP